jgi:hypothetical protein
VYATVADLRGEGVIEAQATDARLLTLIDEASRLIDRLTGWFFEPRDTTYRLDGRGTPSIEPPAPPIHIDALTAAGAAIPMDPDNLLIVGAPVQPGFDAPRLSRRHGQTFPRGVGNIEATGRWGYTEDDGTSEGRTPLEIRRACLMLVMNRLPLLGDADAMDEARNRWRIIEERTRDQSYKLDKPGTTVTSSGDPAVDEILLRFRRPRGIGAA